MSGVGGHVRNCEIKVANPRSKVARFEFASKAWADRLEEIRQSWVARYGAPLPQDLMRSAVNDAVAWELARQRHEIAPDVYPDPYASYRRRHLTGISWAGRGA
jgi:hypothetical protein